MPQRVMIVGRKTEGLVFDRIRLEGISKTTYLAFRSACAFDSSSRLDVRDEEDHERYRVLVAVHAQVFGHAGNFGIPDISALEDGLSTAANQQSAAYSHPCRRADT